MIDAKNYSAKSKIEVRRGELWVAGRRRNGLVDGLAKQLEAVRAASAEFGGDVPIHGAFCFAEGGLPVFRTLKVRGFPLLWPRRMAKRLNAPGPLSCERIELLHRELAVRLPAAVSG